MKKRIFLGVVFLIAIFSVNAQQNFKLLPDFVSFFTGKWTGAGAFNNGKTIEADVFIHPAADSSWLMYEHVDRSPNRYKAVSMWGIERGSGQFLAFIFFNGQSHNQFESDGWKDDKLVLNTHYVQNNATRWQRFIYEKLSDNSFKMTYEVSTDSTTWKMGDYLVFKRV